MSTDKLVVALCVVACIYGSIVGGEPVLGQSHGDVFHVKDVLPSEIQQGPNYRIDDIVSLKGHQYVFTIDSDFGQFEADGRDVLNLRLRELKSIEAAKTLAKDPHLVNGVLSPLEDTGKGAKLLIKQPLETIGSVPKGFDLMVDQFLDPADRHAGSLERRKLAAELDCDPETRNPVLKKLLDDMSLNYGGGGLLTKAAMTFVPGLSLIPMTAETKEAIANNPPHIINDQINKKLAAAGVDKSVRSRFCKSKAFTTLQRVLLMEQFKAMGDIPGRAALVEAATYANTEGEALGAIRAGKMIVDLGQRKAIRELTFVGLPMAVLRDGTHVIVCQYDYVTNTVGLIDGVNAYRASNPQTETILLTTGGISAAARKTLERAHIEIVEEDVLDR